MNYIIIDLPAPANITRAWRFGSCLGLMLIIQIVTGFLLTTRYVPELSLAYRSVIEITRETVWGAGLRRAHANGASIFFVLLYFHMGRGLVYESFLNKITWHVGVIIYLISMATAFIGYLLPWGQIRFWGATVITNLFSAIPYIGYDVVSWIWGGYSVGGATLGRFYRGHFILPFIIRVLVGLHLILLHDKGSRNPLGISRATHKISFHSLFSSKDIVGFILLFILFGVVVFYFPNILRDPDNFIPANRLVTPTHIKPEWYFLWAYAILRAVPNKLGGVVALFSALLILFFLPYKKGFFPAIGWYIIIVVVLLSWIGASPVEVPYESLGLFFTVFYFILMFIILI